MGFGIRYATSSPYWQYYYFGKNIQGDVIALYRSDYNSSSQSYYPTLVATYSYDPWGTPTGIYDANGNAISQTAYNVAAYNPFRYRGYRYDGDTRLYYLQSRYYDPAVGRFINADSPNFALANPYSNGITDKNYFAYCDNNPINRNDDGGEFWNIVVGAIVGGVAGVVNQVVSDSLTTLATGKKSTSNWQTYVGAFVGGAAGGAVLGATGNVGAANAVSGAVSTGAGLALEKATTNKSISWSEIAINSAVEGAVSYGLGKMPGVKRITKGRNSWDSVYRAGLTKLRNGTAKRMSVKIALKGLGASTIGSWGSSLYSADKRALYGTVKGRLKSLLR